MNTEQLQSNYHYPHISSNCFLSSLCCYFFPLKLPRLSLLHPSSLLSIVDGGFAAMTLPISFRFIGKLVVFVWLICFCTPSFALIVSAVCLEKEGQKVWIAFDFHALNSGIENPRLTEWVYKIRDDQMKLINKFLARSEVMKYHGERIEAVKMIEFEGKPLKILAETLSVGDGSKGLEAKLLSRMGAHKHIYNVDVMRRKIEFKFIDLFHKCDPDYIIPSQEATDVLYSLKASRTTLIRIVEHIGDGFTEEFKTLVIRATRELAALERLSSENLKLGSLFNAIGISDVTVSKSVMEENNLQFRTLEIIALYETLRPPQANIILFAGAAHADAFMGYLKKCGFSFAMAINTYGFQFYKDMEEITHSIRERVEEKDVADFITDTACRLASTVDFISPLFGKFKDESHIQLSEENLSCLPISFDYFDGYRERFFPDLYAKEMVCEALISNLSRFLERLKEKSETFFNKGVLGKVFDTVGVFRGWNKKKILEELEEKIRNLNLEKNAEFSSRRMTLIDYISKDINGLESKILNEVKKYRALLATGEGEGVAGSVKEDSSDSERETWHTPLEEAPSAKTL